jgi:transmembrane sensor
MQQLFVDPSLLRQYIDGQCTKEQLATVHQYLHDPVYRDSLDDWLQSDWQDVSRELFPEEKERIAQYRQFLTLVQVPVQAIEEQAPVKRIAIRNWWQAAAAAVFIVAIGWIGWQWQQNSQKQKIAAIDNQWIVLQNEAGKRTEILLPDGSQVYLGAVSTLQYNKNYGVTNREIILKGEAYFIVKHAGKPFSVHTGPITTVDIGTAFNIRYRNHDPSVQVTVAEGAVNVVPYKQLQTGTIASLTRQQQLAFDTITRTATVRNLPDDELIGGWREGILVFRKQSLGQVAAELERYYGIRIQFTNPQTAHTMITTTIHKASTSEALDIIALTAGVTVTRSGKEVLIK